MIGVYFLRVLWLCSFSSMTSGNAVISVARETTFIVNKPGQFTIFVSKTGRAQQTVTAIVEIVNGTVAGHSDFVGTSQSIAFPAGVEDLITPATFTIADDGHPEPDYTYAIQMKVTSGDAVISQSLVATVTVVANNDPFGVFGFLMPTVALVVQENPSGGSNLSLVIERKRGNYDSVAVTYEVSGNQSTAVPGLDVVPASGVVKFGPGESSRTIDLLIVSDQIPENDETFIVKLVSVAGGYSVEPSNNRPIINVSSSELTFTIAQNDAPMRFSQAEYRAYIDSFYSTVFLSVYRGIDIDGKSLIGPINQPALVYYYLLSGTAVLGVDFLGTNGSIGFSPGITSSNIAIQILPSTSKKTDSRFNVVLHDPIGDVVLVQPFVATVIINSNDDYRGVLSWKFPTVNQSLNPLITVDVDEDTGVNLTVARSGGTYGIVSVQWLLTRNDSTFVTDDGFSFPLNPRLGLVVINDGISEKEVSLTVVDSNRPTPALLYRLDLLSDTVTGGARIGGVPTTYIIVKDSHAAHGIVEFANSSAQKIIMDENVRKLRLLLRRDGGTLGDLVVSYDAVYSWNGTVIRDVFKSSVPGSVYILAGQNMSSFDVVIKETVFIRLGASFLISLTGIRLAMKLDVGPYKSPLLGSARSTAVMVTGVAANGEVGFMDTTTRTVLGPLPVNGSLVKVLVVRDGTNGNVTIFWNISGTDGSSIPLTEADVTPLSGSISMMAGESTADVVILILPKNKTELEKEFLITLLSTDPQNMQTLKAGSLQVKVIIPEMGNPAGVFRFGSDMNSSYVIQEEKDIIQVTVVRSGSTILSAAIQYFLEPNGDGKFYGGSNVLYFQPTDTTKSVAIIAKDDGVPQLDIMYTLRLRSYGPRRVVIGEPNTINVTVLAANQPYGIFTFPVFNYTVTTVKRKGQYVYDISMIVKRLKGSFSLATVDWSLINSTDLVYPNPIGGTLTFPFGQSEGHIDIRLVVNDIPRLNVSCKVILSNPSGNAVLGPYPDAMLVVLSNDYAIYFTESRIQMLVETSRPVNITRDGPVDVKLTVWCRTVNGTAYAWRDFIPIDAQLTFGKEERSKELNISILNSRLPQPDESFHVIIYDLSDPLVVTSNLTVIITAHSVSNGEFRFGPPFSKTGNEGAVTKFAIIRDKGIYNPAVVSFEIRTANGSVVPDGVQFQQGTGSVIFGDLQSLGEISVFPLDDGIPEFDQQYQICLCNVSGGPSSDPGRLATRDLIVNFTIAQSNHPYGFYHFQAGSRQVYIAEDYLAGQENTTVASLVVERTSGAADFIRDKNLAEYVVWEAYSYQIAGAHTLPSAWDILLLGSVPSGVRQIPSKRRPSTGTTVLEFLGCSSCYVTALEPHHYDSTFLQNEFTLTAWIQSTSETMSGCVIAKTSLNGSMVYYALVLTTLDDGTTAVNFQYLNDLQTPLSITFGLEANLADGLWHFLLVEIYSGMLSVFSDGINHGQSVLNSALQSSTMGMFSVGATKSGQSLFTGLMQDVRIYDGTLDSLQIQELFKMPSVKDISPISGYLTFQAQDSHQIMSLASLDNNIEEPNKVFSIRLVCAKGLADIPSMDDTSIVTVLKSDNANGLFGFVGTYFPSPVDMLDGSIACLLQRRKGSSDSVTLSWIIVGNASEMTLPPTNEFVNVTGVVVFQPGQRFSNITLNLYDDGLPKLTEYLTLMAVSVIPGDGLVGSTPTSGASIDPVTSSLELTIQPRNYPYGLLQFSSDTFPPKSNDSRIPPAIVKIQRSVNENVGVISLLVVRAQGILGFVSAEWKTVDGTAKSSGKIALDYVSSAGQLALTPGQRYTYINVTILAPPSPVGVRQFDVVLLNPKGGAGLGLGSTITVSIEASRLASGVFQFDDSSLAVAVEEISGAVAVFNVIRLSGATDSAIVTWQFVVDGKYPDLNNTDGTVYFASGQTVSSFNVVVVNDGVPSLDHVYTLQLTNTTKGYLGQTDKLFANVTVLASNDPYGVFVISSTTRYLEVESVAANVSIVVERKKNSGLYGSVIVNYATISPTETYPYIPTNVLRADYTDYDYSAGFVVFPSNSTTAAFNISTKADDQPQLDQSIFARLTAVTLTRGEQPRLVLNSPRLGDVLETYAQIVVKEHNNPNGVLQLSNSSVRITEDYSGPVVYVVRTGGSFGMVSVRFATISGTAVLGKDFSISSDKVILGDGETRVPVPVAITNNLVPQLEHSFTIQLLNETTGGARLGILTQTVVTIEDYDYPHGIFGFEGSLAVVNEPRSNELNNYVLTIQRTHGTFGVVEVLWSASITGETSVKGISPTSGKVFFTSSDAQERVTVNILPVDPSQVLKVITLTITDADNGGTVDASKNKFIIRVIPIASPYGTVLFNQSSYNVVEPVQPAVQYLPLSRINGTYGTLRVFYSLEGADILKEAKADGSSVFDYYRSPLSVNVVAVGTIWNVKTDADPLLACATYCLLSRFCQSFVFVQQRSDCVWFPALNSPSLENRTGYAFYVKSPDKADSLYNRLATPKLDFVAEDSANVTCASGSVSCDIPVYILPDNIPELTEKFIARLLKVELVDGDIGNPNFFPKLGDVVSADVYVAANQDPNGVFAIYSADPLATSVGQVILVEQSPSYSVQLVVERKGGSIGRVSVDWFIDSLYTTAIKGEDYFADGATLIFQPGETIRVITVGIGETNIPADDTTVMVSLGRAQGGATISNRSNVSIIIMAHDFVAGLLSFNQTSYSVNEGDLVLVAVERTLPAHGRVTLIWQIMTENNSPPPDQRFLSTSGMISFNQGELEKIFAVNVALRNLPAVNDEYHIILTNVTTTGVRPSGAAAVTPSKGIVVLTIAGGHEPFGVLGFASSSLNVKAFVANATVPLTIIRKQGTIGSVQVFYKVGLGSLDPLDDYTILAKPNVSFVPVTLASQTFSNGENESQILVNILDDGYPRPSQVFLVSLIWVQLLQPASSAFAPHIASEAAVAQVTILAGDGVQGEVLFLPQYAMMTVESVAGNITLQIRRDKGTFGQVSVFCFAQTPKNGANQGEDFNFNPKEIYFGPGDRDQPVTVQILPSNAPKPDRQFQIVLASPKNGLKLGSPSQAVITILANDLAGGVVNFDSPDNVTIKIPASASTTAVSKVVLRVVRGPGIYGIVNVPFKVSGISIQQSTHLSPLSGVVTFNDRQSFTILEITPGTGIVIDHDELYSVVLLQPDGGAVLGKINQKLVILQSKGTPSGIVQIYLSNTKNTTARVHAVDQAVYLDVVRTDGATGRIAVDVATQSFTAFGRSGPDLYLSVFDQIFGISVQRWYSCSANGDIFLVQLSNQPSGSMLSAVGSNGAMRSVTSRNITALYRWQGMLVYVQSIETDGAQAATSFDTDDGTSYLFVANGGSEKHVETKSRLYQFRKDGSLLVVQDINTMGAADVLVIENNGKRLLIVANYRNDQGSTNILSTTYLWDDIHFRFSDSPFQYLSTKGARILEAMVIANTTYVMLGCYFDSDMQSFELSSVLYRVDDSCHLILHQKITTRGIIDMVSFNAQGATYLVIAHSANSSSQQLQQIVFVSQWNELIEQFISIQELNIRQVQRLHLIRLEVDGPEHLVVASLTTSEVYRWETGRFIRVWQGGAFVDFFPFPVDQSSGRLVVVTDIPSNASQPVTVWQLSMIGNSDFVPRTVTMVFEDGQTLLHTSAAILNDVTHSEDEVFYVQLVYPQFDAQIGQNWQVEITILSNVNPYGVIGFSQESVNRNVDETMDSDTGIVLRLLRQQGTSGKVIVSWKAASVSQSMLFVIPTDGQVVFLDGVSSAFINITIHVDGPLSADQTNIVRLVEVVQSTGSDRGLGAVIGASSIATLMVYASDPTFGSVSWESSVYLVSAPNTTASVLMTYILRGPGSAGRIVVSYRTEQNAGLPTDQQAQPWKDFVPVDATIDMVEGVTRIPIQITVLPNDEPELAESFFLNITNVQLVGQVSGSGIGPRVRRPGNIATVKISEHGNARGVIQFNVTRNIENRVDVDAGERISLSVSRTLKMFGEVDVSWITEPRTADASRFAPSTGVVTFADGQTSSSVDIAINNFLSQTLLTFDVKLLAVATVGATLGNDVSVLVGILPNDSPAGVFSISPSKVTIKESQSVSDPAGFATFTIIRAGTLGTVNVQWRMDPEGQNDFVPPIFGLIQFAPGETAKSLSVQSKPDSIVEGEEQFRISLVYADNAALISSKQSSAVVVILADPKAIGTIGVSSNSSTIAIGKPFPGYDGSGVIELVRMQGLFGKVQVMWQLERQDSNLFTQTQGNVTFNELQSLVAINLQTVDNLTPVLRQNFVLQLISASGGALLQTNASQAQVIFVAGNHPRGLFEFDLPLVAIASRYQSQITVDVIRNFGSSGQVRVYYVTSPGNATSTPQPLADYVTSSGWLTYNEGQTRQTVTVQIYNNNIPQGPVVFYINLTKLELISPTSDNYAYLNGLQLDQPPGLGTKTVKTIVIDKSTDAGGYVQFSGENSNVTAYRDVGFISLPVSRGPGTYGSISVKYFATDLTTKLGLDYIGADGLLSFLDSQTQTLLNISLINDGLTKPARSFLVNLTNATGGARLGNRIGFLVTIARSGYPNGKFGFRGQSPVILQNPDSLTTLTVALERTVGLLGAQNVYWRIMGPNNQSRILTEVTDISVTTADGLEATSGVLTWTDSTGGTKSIVLNIKPHLAWEVQEEFLLIIYDIRSSSASVASGDISPLAGSLSLVIQKFGYPNGVVRFDGVALSPRTFDKPVLGEVSIIFPIIRSQGMLGNISVSWRIDGPSQNLPKDFADSEGMILMGDGSPESQIVVTLIPDNTPSLSNQYTLILSNVIGGADIDSNFQSSIFSIRYHDYPHGRFLLIPALQQVAVQQVSLKRQLVLNITRIKGSFGSVLVSFQMSFDQAQSGTSYLPASGSVNFPNGVSSAIASVDLESSVFLPLGSNFTVTLTSAKLLDAGVTMAPDVVPEQKQVKVMVLQIAANSKVGFQSTVITVNDVSGSVIATLTRLGSYGSIQVQWMSGYQSNDLIRDFAIGSIAPSSGIASMTHGQDSIQLTLQTSPQLQKQELFSVFLPIAPTASTIGGAQLLPGFTICRIDPYGAIQFSKNSRFIAVSLASGQMSQVSLQVERVYGSLDNVQVDYKIYTGSASGELDFKYLQYNNTVMTQGQISANVLIQVNSFGSYMANDKHFYVTLVDVIRIQKGSLSDNSPRIASNGTTAAIVVKVTSNPYGLLSVSLLPPSSNGMVVEGGQIGVLVSRTGGSSGQVSARLRTVGGGESWDQEIDKTPDGRNETIGSILSNRDITKQAIVGQDYAQLDVLLNFADGETSKGVFLSIMNSTQPEYDENVFVYVLPLTEGVKVALPSTDSGLKGFVVVTIMKHGLWNGWIGFYPGNSSMIIADKDSGKPPVLTIERQNASFTSVTVYWRALDGVLPRFPPINLADLLAATSGSVNCLAGQRFCIFTVNLNADKRPRNETWFLVELYLDPSTTSALVDPMRRDCNVTLLKSNYPNGLIQMAPASRVLVVNRNTTLLQLLVERLGYLDKLVMVTYKTLQLNSVISIAGLSASPALEGADYSRSVGTITFDYGVSSQLISVTFDPMKASGGPYPKAFRVQLISVTSNAEMGLQWSNVTIVDTIDEPFWKVWVATQQQLNNDSILAVMQDLSRLLPRNITKSQLAIIQDVLDTVVTIRENMMLAPSTSFSIMSVLCDLLHPGKIDSTRGHWQLSKQLERYAYSIIDHSQCDISATSPDCVNVNFQVYRKYPDDINGMSWEDENQDSFTFPGSLMPVQSKGRHSSTPTCFTLVMVEYKTEQWFTSSEDNLLLNNRILSASIENRDSQSLTEAVRFSVKSPQGTMPPTLADCVYFDELYQQWTSGSGVCTVENNLILGVDNYVSCSCEHMSSYAVRVNTKNNSLLVGYPIWFHISCFICMGCLTLVILTHHLCHPLQMFPINLLMHMCFAIIATEICYVVDGFLSPWQILHTAPGGDNYRCIIMSVFLHYFFLAQFCWLMIQAANLYRVLLLNDEQTRRFYLPFFLFGWIAPVIFVGIFYLVVYLIYRFATDFPVDHIYGDVLGNSNFCFLTNGYVALGGILLPCAVCLLVVGAVCVQAFALYQQWEDYDNIYSGKRNMREVKLLFAFWFLFVLTSLWMVLHVSLGQMWTVVLFVIFNIVLGLYGLIVYGIIRWTFCLECCAERKEEKPQMFQQNTGVSPIPVYSLPNRVKEESALAKGKDLSPSQSKAMMEPESDSQQAPALRVRRSAPSPTNITSPYDKRPTSHGVNMLDDFDDIIYSLKDDGDREYKSGVDQNNKFRDRKYDRRGWEDSAQSEISYFEDDSPVFYEKKRINIADTHI